MIKLIYSKDDFNVYRLNQDEQNNFIEILITEDYNFNGDERPILTANINYKTQLIFMVNPCRAYSFNLHNKYVEVLNDVVSMLYNANFKEDKIDFNSTYPDIGSVYIDTDSVNIKCKEGEE